MAVDRVESLRAYRDALRRRFDQATHAALENVPGGEWDGMDVLLRAELERIIHDVTEAEPEPAPNVSEVRAPGRVFVDTPCPSCGISTRIVMELHGELLVSDEGREIRVKGKSKASAHTCGQLPLPDPEDRPEDQLTLSNLVGPVEPVLILTHDVERYADADLALPEDERCNAEVEIPDAEEESGTIVLICERSVDHDEADVPDPREHWAEGGLGWHYEDRPIPAGITNDPEAIEPDGGAAGPWPEDENEDTGAEG